MRQTNEELAREFEEHKRTEEALQGSEERYRSILNASPDDITITDLAGRILMISPAALRLFGTGGDDHYLGCPVTDFIVPEDRQRALAQIALKCQGITTGTNEYRGLRRDGSTFHIEVNSGFIRNAQGAPTGMVFIVRDITDRMQAQAEKEKLEAQNRQLHKNESLVRMAGAIAHTFNNQLGAVIGNLELALMDLPNGAAAESITAAMHAARQAAAVSGQMLTYLGQSFGKREPLDLCAACQWSLTIVRAILPAKVLMEVDLPSPGPVVSANENQIQQVLTNLVTNAWEAVGENGGSIHLEVKTVSREEIPAAHFYPLHWQPQAPSYACLQLADTGCGIADKNFENLFDPFFSSKFTGRGMGLAMVLGIVRAHGGAITVESEPGRGSTFSVFLPVSTDKLPERPASTFQGAALDKSRAVLLVEDESMLREMTAGMVKCLGLTLIEAKNGAEAVALFRQRQAEIGCVICDLTMPCMNGWETIAALRKIAPGLPVILASGYGKAQVMSGEHAEWPQVFLAKPYGLKELSDAISQALACKKAIPPKCEGC